MIRKGDIVSYLCKSIHKKDKLYAVKSQFMEVVRTDGNYVIIRHVNSDCEGVWTRKVYLKFISRKIKK